MSLHPDRCDHCGRCVPACPVDALRIGPSYIGVEWSRCTQCFACVHACNRQAIQLTVLPARGEAVGAPVSDTSKVVVGSRAEAKAVRKAAVQATKMRGKSVAYAGKPAFLGVRKAVDTAGAAAVGAAGAVQSPEAVQPSSSADSVTPSIAPVGRVAEKRRAVPVVPFVPGTVNWNVFDLLLVLGMLLLTVVAKDAVLGLHAVGLMPAAGRTIVRAAVLGVYYSLQLAAFAWMAARHKATLSAAFGLAGSSATADDSRGAAVGTPSAAGSLGLVLVLFAGTEVFAISYGLLMQAVGLSQPARLSSDLSAVFGGGGVGLALSILLVALVAPFVEELAFRGVVLPVLGPRFGMWPAIVGSAAIYAAYHFSLWLFLPTFVLGIALGWLAWTRRSLWPAILLHVLYNASAVAAGFFIAR
jgi:membrane protease YdiL (CAAX protease family)/NAD-dependent dihydropyrimidine dehydrogenase PreA subunit